MSKEVLLPSLLSAYDDLCRNEDVLLQTSEEAFLSFVVNAGINRRRWEHAELECKRLSIELTRASQDIQSLEQKLLQARTMLDKELSLRKTAEQERDRLHQQLQLLRQIVLDENVLDEVTMDRIRNIDPVQSRTELLAALTSPRIKQPVVGILKNMNMTGSIYEVDDLTFDDTHELCESRSRLFDRPSTEKRKSSSRGKRTRSGGRQADQDVVADNNNDGLVLENIASPRKNDPDLVAAHKRARRSRSVVAFQVTDESTTSSSVNIERGRQQRAFSLTENPEVRQSRRDSQKSGVSGGYLPVNSLGAHPAGEHQHFFVQKAALKPEKCFVCVKRIKFGKICLKCSGCRITIHSECSSKAPPLCTRSQSPEVCVTPRIDRGSTRSPSKKSFFASPMLR